MRPLGLFALAGVVVAANILGWQWYKKHTSPVEFLTPREHQIDMQPSVSPDGKRVAFIRFRSLAVLDLTSRQVSLFALPNLHFHSHPTWSSDGERLTFSAFHRHAEDPSVSGVHLITLDMGAGKWECLTAHPDNHVRAQWSPNGQHLLLTRSSRKETCLLVWEAKTKKLRRIGLANSRAGAWSPDGKWIAFVRNHDLWLMDAQGNGARPLLETPGVDENEPCWTPDGAFLVFTRQRHLALGPEGRDLWALRLADRQAFPLAQCAPGLWAMGPCVQPDGRAVVFSLRIRDHSVVLCRLWVDWTNPQPVALR